MNNWNNYDYNYNPYINQGRGYNYINPDSNYYDNRNDLFRLQQYMDARFNVVSKSMEVLNYKLESLNKSISNLQSLIKSNNTTSTVYKKNPYYHLDNDYSDSSEDYDRRGFPIYRRSNKNKKTKNYKKSTKKPTLKDITKKKTSTKKKPETNMIIHIKDLEGKKGKSNPFDSPFGMLGSLSNIFTQFNHKDTKPKKNETETDEDEVIEYDSEDEFEELDEIKDVDDLIKLGNKFKDIIKKDSKTTKTNHKNDKIDDNRNDKDPNKNNNSGGITTTSNTANIKKDNNKVKSKDNTENESDKKQSKSSDTKTNKMRNRKKKWFEANGKKYSINLGTLYKLQKPLMKLKSLIGLNKVKKDIVDMVLYYMQEFERKNNNMLHTVIEGPPGVGKTELGKILAEIYAGLGIIKSNKFKLVKRTDLIGEYLGHTAIKTQKAIDEADGGVLFIDETYSLGNNDKRDSYSKECIDTLNQNLSENKNRFICIIAGYSEELDKCFFSVNPGLKRRFPFRFKIEGYDHKELRDIFLKKLQDIRWKINTNKIDHNKLTKFFKDHMNDFTAYGGDIENLLTHCKFMHSRRVAGKHPKLRKQLTIKDIFNGLDRFKQNKKKEESGLSIMYI
jgi:hypothetical protein